MDNSEVITIIVPVYNVELYFDRCVKSILNQSYTNLQIILIDDGSTDKSGELCDKYATVDKRIEVFHQEHQGVASSRNFGLEKCLGDYIGFVDSDDWIEPEMFESMLKALKKYDADAVRCNFCVVRDNKKSKYIVKSAIEVLSGREAISDSLTHSKTAGHGTMVWNTLFKSQVFKIPDLLLFNPEITIGEDADVIRRSFFRCNSVLLLDDCYYNYNKDNKCSITHSVGLCSRIESIDSKIKFLENNGFTKREIDNAKKQRIRYLILIDIQNYINAEEAETNNINSIKALDVFLLWDSSLLRKIKYFIIVLLIKMKSPKTFVAKFWNLHK